MELEKTVLSHQRILLSNSEMNVLGPELRLEQCNVISDTVGKGLIVAGFSMIGGTFEQRRALYNFHFKRTHFQGVTFSGVYVGCDFGGWEPSEMASIENCNFIDATLDGCRFLNCETKTIKFARWPCFTIHNPNMAREYVLSQKWPVKVGIVLDVYTNMDPECVAICGNAASISKNSSVSLEDLRILLAMIPNIQFDE
jgi:hypothetical protein